MAPWGRATQQSRDTRSVNQLVDNCNSFRKVKKCVQYFALVKRSVNQQLLLQGKKVCAIFCDISKAFDRVWYKGLLCKLQTVGIIPLYILQWFTVNLNNRKQRVVLPGVFSSWTDLKLVCLKVPYLVLYSSLFTLMTLYAILTHWYASSQMTLASIL